MEITIIIILIPITKYQIHTHYNETKYETYINIILKLHPISVMTVVN